MDDHSARRWFKHWAQDELAYAPLALCSLEAQGLFGRLRSYLHLQSEPYGHLGDVTNPTYLEELEFALRVPQETLLRLVAELEKRRVLVKDDLGRLYSPRMVESEETRRHYAEKGRLGGLRRTAQAPAATAAQAAQTDPQNTAQAPSETTLNTPLKDRARGRGSSSSSSSTSSSEGVQGELPPHVPTVEEFVAHFMADGIPRDYLEDQWAKFEGNRDWLTRLGQMRDFRVIVRGRWKADRGRWMARQAESRDPISEESREARKREIEKALETEKDTARRKQLFAELKRLLS